MVLRVGWLCARLLGWGAFTCAARAATAQLLNRQNPIAPHSSGSVVPAGSREEPRRKKGSLTCVFSRGSFQGECEGIVVCNLRDGGRELCARFPSTGFSHPYQKGNPPPGFKARFKTHW